MINLRGAPRKKRDDEWQQYGLRNPMTGMSTAADTEEPTAKKKSFMDGGGFGWRDGLGMALAGIGDAFAREGGGEGGALNSIISRAYSARDLATKAQAKQAEDAAKFEDAYATLRSTGYDDARARAIAKGYLSAGDAKPERFANKAGDQFNVGPDGKPSQIYTDNTPEFQATQGGVYALDRHTGGQFGQQQQQPLSPPPEAIQALQSNPALKDDFDAMYGQGASSRFMSGGAGPSQAPRTFRAPRLR